MTLEQQDSRNGSERRTLDISGLDSRVFEAFAGTSKREYMYLCNVETNVSRWSQNAVEFFGLPDEYMFDAGAIWADHVHPDDRQAYLDDIDAVFSGRQDRHDLEYRARDRHGNYVYCTCRGVMLPAQDDQPALFAGTMANHGIVDSLDPITNLYNGSEFLRAMQSVLHNKDQASILLMGLEHFSSINQVHGYAFGNLVLQTVAAELKELMGNRGVVYRMDGPTFALCSIGSSEQQVAALYESVREILHERIVISGIHIPLDAGGGALLADAGCPDEHAARACVIYALEQSKHARHDELVFFSTQEHDDDCRTLSIVDAIRRDVFEDFSGFRLSYQPLISPQTGLTVGMEALLRWSSRQYGEVPPGTFIPLLETDPCFFDLGTWVLVRALEDALPLVAARPGFTVNVNVSYMQLDRRSFRDVVMDAIHDIGFPPQNLCLELTEHCRALDEGYLRGELDFFRAQGIRIALDDFGTGSSSLALVCNLPIDCLKVDRTFISQVTTNETACAMVDAIAECAVKLGVSVCLEGVEDEEVRVFCQRYRANLHQGYRYARPLPLDQLMERLEAEGHGGGHEEPCVPRRTDDATDEDAARAAAAQRRHRVFEALSSIYEEVFELDYTSLTAMEVYRTASSLEIMPTQLPLMDGYEAVIAHIVHPDDRDTYIGLFAPENVRRIFSDPAKSVAGIDVRMLQSDGSYHWSHSELIRETDDDNPLLFLACTKDTQKLQVDAVTGLPNRSALQRHAQATLAARERRGCYMILDLDDFKRVNDTYGHQKGDKLLARFGEELRRITRATDVLGRLGGDEFVAMLPGVETRRVAAQKAEAIIDITKALSTELGIPPVGISIGAALLPDDGDTLEALYAKADAAMYESKRAGKNRYTFTGSFK